METVSFEETTNQFTVQVGENKTESCGVEVIVEQPNNPSKPSNRTRQYNLVSNSKSWPESYIWIILTVIILVVIALAIYFYLRSRRR